MAVVSATKSSVAPMSRSLKPRPSTQTETGADAGKLLMVTAVETRVAAQGNAREDRLRCRQHDLRQHIGILEFKPFKNGLPVQPDSAQDALAA